MSITTALITTSSISITEGTRVLHLLDTPNFAGTERHLMELVRSLLQLGVRPVIGCRAGSEIHRRALATGLEVCPCWTGGGAIAMIRGIVSIIRLVKNAEIELIHAHNGRTMLTAACVNRLTGVPAVATQHFINPRFTTYRGIKRVVACTLHDWMNHRLSSIICVSESVRKSMLVREKVDCDKLITVPNGIQPVIGRDDESTHALRRQLGVVDSTVLVAAICRLEPEKGVEYLLDAFALLAKKLVGAHLVIAGDGSQRERLERLVEKSSVSFLGFRDDVPEILAAADIFVLPSPEEPFGLAVIEALSASKPVIACNAGGPAEILTDGVDGRLVAARDAVSLAGVLEELIADPQSRRRLGQAGFQTYQSRFTAELMARNTLDVYQSVAKKNCFRLHCLAIN